MTSRMSASSSTTTTLCDFTSGLRQIQARRRGCVAPESFNDDIISYFPVVGWRRDFSARGFPAKGLPESVDFS